MPEGTEPVIVTEGVGEPPAVMFTVELWFTATAADAGLVIDGAEDTLSVKFWFTVPWLLLAWIVIGQLPTFAAPVVPEIVVFPWASVSNWIPGGRLPLVSDSVGFGVPDAATTNVEVVPAGKVVELAELNCGGDVKSMLMNGLIVVASPCPSETVMCSGFWVCGPPGGVRL
jgi:hypothetical protein